MLLRAITAVGLAVLSLPCGAGLADAKQFRQILTGTVELTRPTAISARRLVFKDYTIVTNGFPLEISADTLTMSGKNSIIAFAPRAMGRSQPGRDAGKITINVRDLDGETLIIRNDGEAGGPGEPGSAGANGLPGSPAGDAASAWLKGCAATAPAGPGGQGGPGGRGGPGGAGGRGGDVAVDVVQDSDKLDISTRGGAGAEGGPGGPGGAGGPGGTGGKGNARCAASGPGTSGPQGPAGEPGARGTDGAAGKILSARYRPEMGVKR